MSSVRISNHLLRSYANTFIQNKFCHNAIFHRTRNRSISPYINNYMYPGVYDKVPLLFSKSIFIECGCLYYIPHAKNKIMNKRKYDSSGSNMGARSLTSHSGEKGRPHPANENISKIRTLVATLSPTERKEILIDLQYQDADEIKQKAEDKLASYRWRSRFGRPSSLPHPGNVDPTGTYCEIPAEWLKQKIEEEKHLAPTSVELRQIALFNALPFIGFGFLDNVIMIVAGDYIDITIGTYLGISTMAAAALGNTISDLAGIGSAWYVEMVATRIGVRQPDLTREQLNMSSSRWSANLGRGFGVCFGCILGMFPLFLLSDHSKNDKKEKEVKPQT